MPVIPALRRSWQEDCCECEVSLGSTETPSQKTVKSREKHCSELVFHIKWQLQPVALWFLQAMKLIPMG